MRTCKKKKKKKFELYCRTWHFKNWKANKETAKLSLHTELCKFPFRSSVKEASLHKNLHCTLHYCWPFCKKPENTQRQASLQTHLKAAVHVWNENKGIGSLLSKNYQSGMDKQQVPDSFSACSIPVSNASSQLVFKLGTKTQIQKLVTFNANLFSCMDM